MARTPRTKKFARNASEFKPLVFGKGACIASDRITVDGERVGYCYREKPDDIDSGWRFFAGDESESYTSDQRNFELYDCNTIANCDPDIVPLLDAPPGSAFVRDETGALIPDRR